MMAADLDPGWSFVELGNPRRWERGLRGRAEGCLGWRVADLVD
jgi:hypothetical protein